MKRFLLHTILFSLAFVLVLELFFRFIIPAPQNPLAAYDTDYNIFVRDHDLQQEGLYTYGRLAEIRGEWKINEAGWNSTIPYKSAAERQKPMIALIGDSYVENLYCDVDKHLERQLEGALNGQSDVYAFGVAGSNMGQYIGMTAYARDNFQPDAYIVLVNHRNLRESLAKVKRKRYLRQYEVKDDAVELIPPKAYKPNKIQRILTHSALFRYVKSNYIFNLDLPELKPWEKAKMAAKEDPAIHQQYLDDLRLTARHIIGQIMEEAGDAQVFFALHPNRESIYQGEYPAKQTEDLQIVKEVLVEQNLAYVDLNEMFSLRYRQNQRKFEFETNMHWNVYGNSVAMEGIRLKFFTAEAYSDTARTTAAMYPSTQPKQ